MKDWVTSLVPRSERVAFRHCLRATGFAPKNKMIKASGNVLYFQNAVASTRRCDSPEVRKSAQNGSIKNRDWAIVRNDEDRYFTKVRR